MWGGRDWDRAIVANIVRPWLEKNFDLPEDASTNQAYRKLFAKLDWAAEKAKIELSSRGEAIISLSEVEVGVQDQNGADIYLDIPLSKEQLRSEEHTSELQSLMRISYTVFCLKKKKK